MTLEEYFNQVLDRYSKKEYNIKKFNKSKPELTDFHLEAQHYMMYEWCEDHWDDRYKDIFDYVLVPKDCDYDFYNTNFEDFLKFLAKIKVKEAPKTKKK